MTTPRTRPRARTLDSRGDHQRLARQTTLWLVAFAGLMGYFLLRYIVLKLPVLPVYTVGPLQVSTFGPLVAMGILFGRHLLSRWCPHFGLEWATLREGIVWFLLVGFGLAHLMAISEASPAQLAQSRETLRHPCRLFLVWRFSRRDHRSSGVL